MKIRISSGMLFNRELASEATSRKRVKERLKSLSSPSNLAAQTTSPMTSSATCSCSTMPKSWSGSSDSARTILSARVVVFGNGISSSGPESATSPCTNAEPQSAAAEAWKTSPSAERILSTTSRGALPLLLSTPLSASHGTEAQAPLLPPLLQQLLVTLGLGSLSRPPLRFSNHKHRSGSHCHATARAPSAASSADGEGRSDQATLPRRP
mmetsp:Transcript_79576/g.200150  ORF Transcript_79576/g.200150 Transcript_79576/m.200150 type:complete len:210 (-) Transcript_79576:110-739(-)